MTVREEEAVVQAFIKMYKDVTKSGDKLSASHLDQLQKMMKSTTVMMSNTKTQKTNITLTNKQIKFGEKELAVRERLKKADENLVRLRHTLNTELEREHGDQVRRNVNLRANMDSFNDKFEMLKKSLGGGFGFQAAIGDSIKKMGKLTRSYQELDIAEGKYEEALSNATSSARSMAFANTQEDKDEAEKIHKINLEALERTDQGRLGAIKAAEPTQGKAKPIFKQLSQLGEFLGKKAVPIGIGMGVAGILMSIIVKAFSASPLFAQMMKMMKFMVTLILMPIGTFFGALLRPILVLLLRKFIVPMYSKFMPLAMKVGGQVGKWITWVMGGKPTMTAIEEAIAVFTGTEENVGSGGKYAGENPPGTFKTSPDEDFRNWLVELGKFVQDPIGYIKLSKQGSIQDGGETNETNETLDDIKDDTDETNETLDDIKDETKRTNVLMGATLSILGSSSAPGDEDGGIQSNADFIAQTAAEHGLGEAEFIGETEGERQVREDKEERERQALMESDQERTNRELAEAAAEKAERVAFEHADNAHWMELNRSVLDMNKLMETNGIITEAIPKEMFQEMTNFAAYGMEGKAEKGGDIHDAGISMTQEEIDKKNAGYQGYGGLNSTVLEGSGGRSSKSVMDNYNAYLAGVVPAADGFNGMVNSPTMFLAGESGSEHVSITPNGGSGGITVNIQNMNGSDNDLRKLKQTILEVIQQSSANRGRL